MANVIFSLIWLLILIFISFWIAGFCAFFYIILLPLTVCISPLKDITDLFLKGVQLPYHCAQKMMSGEGF